MIRLAVVGVGKMGLSHLAIANMHPGIEVAAVCESSGYVRGVLGKYTGLRMFGDYDADARRGRARRGDGRHPLEDAQRPGAIGARSAGSTCSARSRCRSIRTTARGSPRLRAERGVVTQVGYHHRFVGSFREVRKLLDAGAIGSVTSAQGEAYGPVVLKRKGGTWRSRRPRAVAASTTTPLTRSTS